MRFRLHPLQQKLSLLATKVLSKATVDAKIGQHIWPAWIAMFCLGALTVLSFAPFSWYLLAPVLVIPLLYCFFYCEPRQSAILGFAYGAGLFLTGTHWLYISIHIFGQVPWFLAVLLMVTLVFIMAVYYAAIGFFISTSSRRKPWIFLAVAPTTWIIFEWLRGWLLTGFPWMTLGYSQIDSPLAGFGPIAGIYGVSLIAVTSASAIMIFLILSSTRRYMVLCIAIVPWFIGGVLRTIDWTEVAGPPVRATVVQGGVPQDRKWLREQFRPTLELYRSSLIQNADSDLVLWPEVAIPAVIDQVGSYIETLQSDISKVNTTLLLGILERDESLTHVYNSVIALDGLSLQSYKKRHLVPFGEYFPVPDSIREWMRMMNLPFSDISPGVSVQPLLRMPDGNALSVAICYEDAYAAEQLYALPDATILINVSNDAWFGDSIAPHQHLQIARMRALEVGRYVIRATNNGISAFISPDGDLIQTGEQFRYATITEDVVPRTGVTPYTVVGNRLVITFSLVISGFFALRTRLRN